MTEHEHFDKEDFRVRTAARSYEDCLFTGCLFSSADLRDCEFTDCRFEVCCSLVKGAAFCCHIPCPP